MWLCFIASFINFLFQLSFSLTSFLLAKALGIRWRLLICPVQKSLAILAGKGQKYELSCKSFIVLVTKYTLKAVPLNFFNLWWKILKLWSKIFQEIILTDSKKQCWNNHMLTHNSKMSLEWNLAQEKFEAFLPLKYEILSFGKRPN